MWITVGISGVTCGGKTTLARALSALHVNTEAQSSNKCFHSVRVISQDDYFLPIDSAQHQIIPELNHINFDIITSLDMATMVEDLRAVVRSGRAEEYNLLVIEGFNVFYSKEVYDLCDLHYFFTLDYAECKRRRQLRVYEPPDCEGYFEGCAWPEYIKYLEYVREMCAKVRYFESSSACHGLPADARSEEAIRKHIMDKVQEDLDRLLSSQRRECAHETR